MSDRYPPEVRTQVLEDLTTRARGGIVVYLAAWLITASWYEIASISIKFFWINTSILVLLSLARLFHYRQTFSDNQAERDIDLLTKVLVLLILANGFQLGIQATWILLHEEYAQLHYPSLIMIAAFALGGTVTLAISHAVRIFYPILIFLPPIGSLIFLESSPEHFLLGILALCSLVYITDAAGLASRDYWKAINSHRVAEHRATQLELLSTTDPLTQLRNRLYFNKRYRQEWKRCNRHEIPLSVLMIDLDHFKQINDTYGHLFGDECLREVAATLRRQIPREIDVIARYGGEEFIALLPGTALSNAEQIAEKLLRSIADMKLNNNQGAVSLTCSIGVSCVIPDHRSSEDSLLNVADHALYVAKANGRNRWESAG
jgi:diguanylate cyclase (GGDEF)-like protein